MTGAGGYSGTPLQRKLGCKGGMRAHRASKLPADLTEDVVREVALARGLVDVRVCAIDETWSGLKLVTRLENR